MGCEGVREPLGGAHRLGGRTPAVVEAKVAAASSEQRADWRERRGRDGGVVGAKVVHKIY